MRNQAIIGERFGKLVVCKDGWVEERNGKREQVCLFNCDCGTKEVKKVVRDRIQPIVGLKFVFVPSGGEVRIGFDPYGGCWSLVGTDCIKSNERTTMNFGWLDAATIVHEFCHALGMIHEHQNPKNNPIKWNKPVVYSELQRTNNWDKSQTDHNMFKKYVVVCFNTVYFITVLSIKVTSFN